MKSSMIKVSSADVDAIYDLAFSKRSWFEKTAAPGQPAGATPPKPPRTAGDRAVNGALIGLLAGGGLGALNHFLTPEDKDEKKWKRLLLHVLGGAALGGVAGAGVGYSNLIGSIDDAIKGSAGKRNDMDLGDLAGAAVESRLGNSIVLGSLGLGAGKIIPEMSTHLGGTGFGAATRAAFRKFVPRTSDLVFHPDANPAASFSSPLGTLFGHGASESAVKALNEALDAYAGGIPAARGGGALSADARRWRTVVELAKQDVKHMSQADAIKFLVDHGLMDPAGRAARTSAATRGPTRYWNPAHPLTAKAQKLFRPNWLMRRFGAKTPTTYGELAEKLIRENYAKARTTARVGRNLGSSRGMAHPLAKHGIPIGLAVLGALGGFAFAPNSGAQQVRTTPGD